MELIEYLSIRRRARNPLVDGTEDGSAVLIEHFYANAVAKAEKLCLGLAVLERLYNSPFHQTTRSASNSVLATVPLPIIEPALSERVLAAWLTARERSIHVGFCEIAVKN